MLENTRNTWEIGHTVLGVYKVINVIGEGGMGKVFQVHHLGWHVDMAVKLVKPQLLNNTRVVEAFHKECELWINLGLHPNIVFCYYVRVLEGFPVIFMEYVEGGSLRKWITKGILYKNGPQIALKKILTIAIQTAWGLQYAHEHGLIHRDFKSSNILVSESTGAKITDFGLAGVKNAFTIEDTNKKFDPLISAGGMTPAYCSPEQYARERISHKSDIWSWALCVIEMLLGGTTWQRGPEAPAVFKKAVIQGSSHPYCPKIPMELAELILWCCNNEPSFRPKDLREVANHLIKIYESQLGKPFPLKEPPRNIIYTDSLNNRAVSLIDLNRIDQAEKTWEECLRLEPNHLQANYNTGLRKWRSGQLTDEKLLNRLIEIRSLHTNKTTCDVLIAQIHLERGDYHTALKYLSGISSPYKSAIQWEPIYEFASANITQSRGLLKTLTVHADCVTSIAINGHNNQYFLSGSEDNRIILWNLNTFEPVYVLAGHKGSILKVIFWDSGNLIASIAKDRSLRIWDAETGKCIFCRKTSDNLIDLINCNVQNRILGICKNGSTLFLAPDFQKIEEFQIPTRLQVLSANYYELEDCVLMGHYDGSISLWNFKENIHSFLSPQIHHGPIRSLTLEPTTHTLFAASEDGSISIWDIETKELIKQLHAHSEGVLCVFPIHVGKNFAATAGKDGFIKLWEVSAEFRCLWSFQGHPSSVQTIAISLDKSVIITGSLDKTIKIWNLGPLEPPFKATYALCPAVQSELVLDTSLTFTNYLQLAQKYASKHQWENAMHVIESARQLSGFRHNIHAMSLWAYLYLKLPKKDFAGICKESVIEAHTGPIQTITFSIDSQILYTGGEDGLIHGWNLANGKHILEIKVITPPVKSLCVDPFGRFLFSVDGGQNVNAWNPKNGEMKFLLKGTIGNIDSIATSPDGTFIAAGGWALTIWHIMSQKIIANLPLDTTAILSLAWSPDMYFLYTGTSGEGIYIWDLVKGELAKILDVEDVCVPTIDISFDCTKLVAGTRPVWGIDGKILIWDKISSGDKLSFSTHAHKGGVTSVSLTLDGQYLLTGGKDGCIYLWNSSTYKKIHTISTRLPDIQCVTFSPDTRYIAAATGQGKVYVWELDWALNVPDYNNWKQRILPFCRVFLASHKNSNIIQFKNNLAENIPSIFKRKGKNSWTNEDFNNFLFYLARAGYGWLSPKEVENFLFELQQKKSQP